MQENIGREGERREGERKKEREERIHKRAPNNEPSLCILILLSFLK
jgi:hypothetical protein